jgi:molybdopterin-containing oxidoreductase family iron-sulfur binding subunit
MPELDRRNFLKVVGAGAGTAATTACSDLPEKLIPYVVAPEDLTPGIATFYASTCQECGAGCGLHVRTREGRPVKLEGNPDHPVNRGALCARGQASIGRSFHPDRFREPMRRGPDGELAPIGWDEAQALLAEKLKASGGRVRMITGQTGPTLGALIDQWLDAVGGQRLVYETFAHESLEQAAQAVFGVASRPRFDLEGADTVVDFGADALESWISPTEHSRQLARARDVHEHPEGGARLIYVGPRLSMTASNADEWLPAKPGTEGVLALGLARVAADAGHSGAADAGLLAAVLRDFDADSVAARTGVPAEAIRRIGKALAESKRPAVLPPGVALTSRRATATTGAVLLLGAVVGAVGKTLHVPPAGTGPAQPASFQEVKRFVEALRSDGAGVLLVHGANPSYSLPPGLGFDEALERADFVVSTASMPDETSSRADLILPDHTPMESWGDSAPRAGVRSLVQPTLRPLFDTRAVGDALLETARAMGPEVAGKLPSGSFRGVLEAAWSDTDWREALAAGGVFRDAGNPPPVQVVSSVSRLQFTEPELEGDGNFVLLPVPSPLLGDGRGANLPWLQETPDPVTKVAWQSWIEISRNSARSLGVGFGDVLALETPTGRVEAPVLPRGGIRDDVVALAIGQGHTVGRFASLAGDGQPGEARGVNVVSVLEPLSDESGGRAWLTTRARLSATGRYRRLPLTQTSDNKRGRQLGEAVSLAALAAGGDDPGEGHGGGHGQGHEGGPANRHGDVHEGHELLRPFDAADDARADSDYRWGMHIDLDRCTGCSACMVACAIENNIPQVGEEGVTRARQMYWIRIERFIGDGEATLEAGRPLPTDREELGSVDVRHSPMLCQQCGAAPCEPVCPVYATYHNEEGLNGMIYNRCIGTRYCSNNCPYKVRRFNWFDYAIERLPEPMRLMLNPDVTVRGQGVMEKCTFCVQRIQTARQTAKDEGRPIRDGEVTPACAQTCPTQAITFGNTRDEKSELEKKSRADEPRAYHALQVLNTRPAITYAAKVKRGNGSDSGEHA